MERNGIRTKEGRTVGLRVFNTRLGHIPALSHGVGQRRVEKLDYALAFVFVLAILPYFLLKRSTRPSASTIFWVPVKKGWQLEQISTFNDQLTIEPERLDPSIDHWAWHIYWRRLPTDSEDRLLAILFWSYSPWPHQLSNDVISLKHPQHKNSR